MLKSTSNLTWRSSLALILLPFLMGSISCISAKAQIPNAWINEIHYDNDGSDKGEGVEIVIENRALFDIEKFVITLYSGKDGGTYKNEVSLLQGNINNINPLFTICSIHIPGIPNEKDGIALSYDGSLLQFLSYEGTFMATEGIAKDSTATDIGVKESGKTPTEFSLQLIGIGDQYKTFSWNDPAANTFGDINTGQMLTPINGPQPITNLQQTYIAPDKARITWIKPIGIHGEDWDGVLLFASKEEPNEIDLKDIDYTSLDSGGNEFGEGTPIGNSFTVARKETNEQGEVIITGLEKGMSYYFTAYTYLNIEGSNNDKFSNPSEEIIVTPMVSNISSLTATSLFEKVRLTWENAMDPAHDWWTELIIVAAEMPITAIPNQKNYVANDTIGKGEEIANGEYVVYAGKAEQTVVYGLKNGTPYYFKAFVRYDNGDRSHWSSGTAITCKPANNIKLWTGKAETNLFQDAANWEPIGVPGPTQQVILDHRYEPSPYEVVFPSGDVPVKLNSLKIIPDNTVPITVKLLAAVSDGATALTLLDETEPLVIGSYGTLINRASGSGETLKVPNGNILLESEGKYVHSNALSHADILTKIKTEEGIIPGTVVFNVTNASNYFTSLSGRSFHKLIFSSPKSLIYEVLGSNPVVIEKELIINSNATLNLSGLDTTLIIKGDLIINGNLTFNKEILFTGTREQLLSGNKAVTLSKIHLNKPEKNLILGTDLHLIASLKLEQGNLLTAEHCITLDYTKNNPQITTASSDTRIIGNLDVTRHVGTSKTVFPNAGLTFEAGEEDLGAVKVVRRTGTEAVVRNGESRSIQKIWEIQASAPLSTSRSLAFSWEAGDEAGLEMKSIKVWQESQPSGHWIPLGNFQDGTLRTITVATNSLTRFTIANENNILPITLLSFSVSNKAGNAVLKWRTGTEINNAGFEIEKSIDGIHFYPIGFRKGSGNSLKKQEYLFTDTAFFENAYFRLKQIDFNGKVSFSPIQYLSVMPQEDSFLKVLPNPLNNKTPLKLSATLPNSPLEHCMLYNMQGEIIYKSKSISLESLQKELNWLIPALPSGLYIMRLQSKHRNQQLKLLKE